MILGLALILYHLFFWIASSRLLLQVDTEQVSGVLRFLRTLSILCQKRLEPCRHWGVSKHMPGLEDVII